ncbi:MAG: glycerate kinase [Planctomycetes bacterium]|nr:glycerate kinase [Planctomycetota bacterium]
MRIILAPDSFKGSLTAAEACRAMAEGVLRAIPTAETIAVPMADGGEGTTEALVSATGGQMRRVWVCGPLPDGPKILAEIGLLGDGVTAVVEMARASGLTLVPSGRRNPLYTTTYGTGEMIAAAVATGIERLIVGIGGSATTDGGAGAAQALGVRFFRANGSEICRAMTGSLLAEVADIDLAGLELGLTGCRVEVACDVDNPLLGPRGAATVYGPQKGASTANVRRLEANLSHFFDIIEAAVGRSVRDVAGAGAAGGLGAGLLAFLKAELKPGVDIVLDACDFSAKVASADLVFTGEGRIDSQTVMGKTISGVARVAAAGGVPVIALAGRIDDEGGTVKMLALESAHSITPPGMPVDEAMANAYHLLAEATERVLRERMENLN